MKAKENQGKKRKIDLSNKHSGTNGTPRQLKINESLKKKRLVKNS